MASDKSKKVSLLDQLKEIENPGLSVNFDESDDEITSAKVTNYALEEDAESESKNFGNLRKKVANSERLEPKYFGNVVKRKNLEEWSDDASDISDDVDDDEQIDSDSDNEEINSDDRDVPESDDEISNDNDSELDEEESATNRKNEEEEESESEIEDDYDSGAMLINPENLPDDLKHTLREPTLIQNDDTETKQSDMRKGVATKKQLGVLDKFLESRIRLQKPLQITNRLPQHDISGAFNASLTKQAKELQSSAKSSLMELLTSLLELQDALLKRNSELENLFTSSEGDKKKNVDSDEEIPSDDDDEVEDDGDIKKKTRSDLPSKRTHKLVRRNVTIRRKKAFSDMEEEIALRHKYFKTFQDTTISKWHEKTRTSIMGKHKSQGFAGFDKSALQQVKHVLSDMPRLIKRTQLQRSSYTILGKSHEDTTQKNEEIDTKEHNENIFDDSDFYHEMLKELIERKSEVSADDPVASGRRWLELQKLRTKIKRKIDTRASKGRKVRYHVHSKLVGFMAPHETGKMSDQARNDLFASLFGQDISQRTDGGE